MRKFERIRIEKGQPYIRDTGISALEIMNQLRRGESLHNVLEKYPILVDEDVVEALIYISNELTDNFMMAISDTRSPISSIISATNILTEDRLELNETQEEQLRTIVSSTGRRLNFMWHSLADWIHIKYRLHETTQSKTSLVALINDVQIELEFIKDKGIIEANIPEELPLISDNGYVSRIFVNLLGWIIYVEYGGHIIASQTTNNSVSVQIIRKLTSHRPSSFDLEKSLWDYIPTSLAALILQLNGTELQIQILDTEIIFEFELPVWEENS